MSLDPHQLPPMFRIDVSADSNSSSSNSVGSDQVIIALLQQMVAGQEKQNRLLEEMNQQMAAAQKQRANELGQWKEQNPRLSSTCRLAAETLSRVQTQFLENLTEEICSNEEYLLDGDFMLNEFVDRYGPRLAHLNGVLQVLSQLSAATAANPSR